jgi:Zinc-finger associated domain (zf-AD)/Zinc finger, C2H2 type
LYQQLVNVCRCCLQPNDLKSVFSPPKLAEMIQICAGIDIHVYKDFDKICSGCERKFEMAYEIRQKARESDEMLQQFMAKYKNLTGEKFQPPPPQEPAPNAVIPVNSEVPAFSALDVPKAAYNSDDDNFQDFDDYDDESEEEAPPEPTPFQPQPEPEPKRERTKYKQRTNEIIESKSLVCHVCGKSYGRPHALNTHFFSQHCEDAFGCHICGKTYRSLHNVKRHLRRVHLKLRHRCDICFKDFYTPTGLKKHKTMDHSGEHAFS